MIGRSITRTNLTLGATQISDSHGNEYGKAKDIAGEQRIVFTSHHDAAFDVCFENYLTGCTYNPWP